MKSLGQRPSGKKYFLSTFSNFNSSVIKLWNETIKLFDVPWQSNFMVHFIPKRFKSWKMFKILIFLLHIIEIHVFGTKDFYSSCHQVSRSNKGCQEPPSHWSAFEKVRFSVSRQVIDPHPKIDQSWKSASEWIIEIPTWRKIIVRKRLTKFVHQKKVVKIIFCFRKWAFNDGERRLRGSYLWHNRVQRVLADDVKATKVQNEWTITQGCIQVKWIPDTLWFKMITWLKKSVEAEAKLWPY